jgi:retron-type reverse transcriptase
MKRIGNLFDAIADWDNLRLATAKAMHGKRRKLDARQFAAGLDANLRRLNENLLAGNVDVGRYHQFIIFDPKQRTITAPCFEERVLHHAILNVCEPVFERALIHDSYACRRGKGRVACLQRAQQFARRYPFFLKLDVRKYFDSVDHKCLKESLARKFKDRRLLTLLERIIDSYEVTPGKGVPIGSLTSQHFANFYLGRCDRLIKEDCRIPGYVRYMDDMALWSNSTAQLKERLKTMESFMAGTLNLELKPVPLINRTAHGMDFLGCRIFPTHQVLNARSRRRFRGKLKAIELALTNGAITELGAQRHAQALIAFTKTTGMKTWRFRRGSIKQ